jgi:hypothetical protein
LSIKIVGEPKRYHLLNVISSTSRYVLDRPIWQVFSHPCKLKKKKVAGLHRRGEWKQSRKEKQKQKKKKRN